MRETESIVDLVYCWDILVYYNVVIIDDENAEITLILMSILINMDHVILVINMSKYNMVDFYM